MDFLPTFPRDFPKMTYECLAVISIGGNVASGRRGSSGSLEGEDGGGLARVLSGGRRRSTAGTATAANTATGQTAPASDGTWYWRAKIGVTDDSLFILPTSEPANPILRQRPTSTARRTSSSKPAGSGGGGGFMNAIRRASAGFIHKPETAHPQAPADGGIPENAVEDTPASPTNGTRRMSAEDEQHRETGWPAVVEGQPLQAIVVPLHNITKDSVHHDSKKGDYRVSVSIGSAVAGKAGQLRFEFDKDWIGAKGESELLYNKLQNAVGSSAPLFQTVQLGGTGAQQSSTAGINKPINLKAGGTHPTGDAEYNPNWQSQIRGKW